jgi:hypothetical protein
MAWKYRTTSIPCRDVNFYNRAEVMNEMCTVEDLADVVAGVRGMLQPEKIRGEVGSVGAGGVARGRHHLG